MLTQKRNDLAKRVDLMGEHIDLDLLDQQVRMILGYVGPGELCLHIPQASR